jgi:hypothetical protein
MKQTKSQQIATYGRGSPFWKYDRFRAGALPSLILDLRLNTEHGISNAQCKMIQDMLGYLTSRSRPVFTAGYMDTSLYFKYGKFLDTYIQWNDIDATSPDAEIRRLQLVDKLQDVREKIAKKSSDQQSYFIYGIEKNVLDSIYSACRLIATTHTAHFPNLRKFLNSVMKAGIPNPESLN